MLMFVIKGDEKLHAFERLKGLQCWLRFGICEKLLQDPGFECPDLKKPPFCLLFSRKSRNHAQNVDDTRKLTPADMSKEATHRLQLFQPGSELVEKVVQPNQPKTVFPQ